MFRLLFARMFIIYLIETMASTTCNARKQIGGFYEYGTNQDLYTEN